MIDFSALGIDKSAEVRLDRILMRQAYEVALSDGKGAVQYKGKPDRTPVIRATLNEGFP